jgi:hypothetical protein
MGALQFNAYAALNTTLSSVLGGAGITALMAWVTYRDKTGEVSMWTWPTPVAGDLAVTAFLCAILTWLSTTQQTLKDCDNGKVMGRPRIASLPSLLRRVSLRQQRLVMPGDAAARGVRGAESGFCGRLLGMVAVSSLLGLLFVLVFGVPFVLFGIYALHDQWTIEALVVYKGVFGLLCAVPTNVLAIISAAATEEGEEGGDMGELASNGKVSSAP